jgi:ankyrin repeat protein
MPKGASSQVRDNDPTTQLWTAIEKQQVEKLLPRIRSAQQYLAEWSPAAHRSDELINPETLGRLDEAGRTPLQLAEELELDELVSELRRYLLAVVSANTGRIVAEPSNAAEHYRERANAFRGLGMAEEAGFDLRDAARMATGDLGAVRSAALHEACRSGNASRVKELLGEGASVNDKDRAGRTLLMKSLAGGHRSLALTLVVLGADLTEQDERGRTVMHDAVEARDKTVLPRLKQLIQIASQTDADPRQADLRVFSGLERSLLEGRTVDVHGIPPLEDLERVADENGETPALAAARIGDWELLVQTASSVESCRARDKRGRTIAIQAAIHGHTEWFERLMHPAYLGVAGTPNVFVGEMLPFDLEQLAVRDSDGKTALDHAREEGHQEIAAILTRHLQAIIDRESAADAADRQEQVLALAKQALGR